MSTHKTKAIIIGASQGIGAELAREFSRRGYAVGLAARSEDKLLALQNSGAAACSLLAVGHICSNSEFFTVDTEPWIDGYSAQMEIEVHGTQ